MSDDINNLVAELLARVKEQISALEKTTVKCGIVGLSGSGKSSLMNAIVGEKVAETGYVETTSKAQPHEHGGVTFVDLPGCSTMKFPKGSYVKNMDLASYDCFILVTANRFLEDDLYLHDQIKSMPKPLFVVRNKIDVAIQDGRHDNDEDESTVLGRVRSDIKANLKASNVETVYCTSARHPAKYDLPKLIDDILESLSGLKRQRFLGEMAAWTSAALEKKKEAADTFIKLYAAASAANAFNPIPGVDVAVDVSLLLALNMHIVHIYGLTDAQAEYLTKVTRNAALQNLAKKTVANMAQKYLTKEAILVALKRIAGRVAAKSMFKWIPFLGTALAGLIGYKMTYGFGEEVQKDAEQNARELLNSFLVAEPTAPEAEPAAV